MRKMLWTLLGLTALLAGCMHDNPEKASVTETGARVSKLTIAAPQFIRTTETKDRWLNETLVQLTLHLPAAGAHASDRDTTLGGFHLSAALDEGGSLDQFMGGSWMMMDAGQGEHQMRVSIVNAGTEGDTLSPLPIMYSNVVVTVKDGGNAVVDIDTLPPIHGSQGLFYGANMTIPFGMINYRFEVHAGVPVASSRDSANQGRIHSPLDTAFPDIMLHGAPLSALSQGTYLFPDSLAMELLVGPPETLWPWDTEMRMPMESAPNPGTTLFVQIKLHDLKSLGHGDAIGYGAVRCRLFTEDMQMSTGDNTLGPVHGANGFYYGANMAIPMMGAGSPHTGH